MNPVAKPMGPIPAGFAVIDGQLAIGGVTARDCVARAGGAPLFIYDAGLIAGRIAQFRAAIPGVRLHYAVKANPFAPLLSFMHAQVDGFDIASGGELALLQQAGVAGARIGFAGPGKRDTDLDAAIAAGVTLHIESAHEASRAIAAGMRLGVAPRVAIRVNPDFDLGGAGMRMGGGARPFGVDAEAVPALARDLVGAGADWQGFHVYAGSQSIWSRGWPMQRALRCRPAIWAAASAFPILPGSVRSIWPRSVRGWARCWTRAPPCSRIRGSSSNWVAGWSARRAFIWRTWSIASRAGVKPFW
jgi:diaminopimelate decarboxylase